MKIGMKLTSGFLSVALLVAVVGITGSRGLHSIGGAADVILDEKVPIATAAMEGMIALISGRDAMGEFMLSEDMAELDKLEKEFRQTVADFDQADTYIKEHSKSEVAALADEADAYHAKFEESAAKLMTLHREVLIAKSKAGKIMEQFDQHVGELKVLLEGYEAELTRDKSIDEKVDAAMEAKTMMVEQQAIAEEYMGLHSLEESGALRKNFESLMAEIDGLEHLLPATVAVEHDDFVQLAMGRGGMFDLKDQALQLHNEAMELMALVDEYSTKGDLTMDKVEEKAEQDMASAMAMADAAMASSDRLIIVMTVMAFLAAIGIGFMLGRHISRPLQNTVAMIQEMDKGHFDLRLNLAKRSDELGTMAQTMDSFAENLQKEVVASLRMMAGKDLTFKITPRDERDELRGSLKRAGADLNEIMTEIMGAGEQVAAASGQVADSSQSLSQGATESASSLEEITSSMTELSSQTKVNAENASQANQLAGQARSAADDGSRQMQEMVTAMTEINEAGQNISKIIKVIDEIAFQTNLLALNAAVEAARAGKHGKGFAVVAEEVRNLAARSAQAAKETAELIEGSVAKTEKGSEIADRTAGALQEIVTGISKVTDLVGEIAAASSEQAQGISQINEGLSQIDQVTQQNTASAEESAAASEQLSGQAAQMRNMLAQFKLNNQPQTGMGAAAVIAGRSAIQPRQQQSPAVEIKGGWAIDTMAQEEMSKKPEEVIVLDDSEFGKY